MQFYSYKHRLFYMRKAILTVIFLLIVFLTNAQNLVPNPSFEDTIQVQGQPGLNTWRNNLGSPDYYSNHYYGPFYSLRADTNGRGGQTPYDGAAIFAFAVLDRRFPETREYLQMELNQTLQKDKLYEVEFFISLADSFEWAYGYEDFGVHFSDTLYPNNLDHKVREYRPYFISDTVWDSTNKKGWEKFHLTYQAKGTEKFMTIGCFKKDSEVNAFLVFGGGSFIFHKVGSMYFIDMIRVEMVDTANSVAENSLLATSMLYPNPVRTLLSIDWPYQNLPQFQVWNQKGQQFSLPASIIENGLQLEVATLPKGLYLLQVSYQGQTKAFKFLKE